MAGKSSKSESELVDPVADAQLGNGPPPGGEVVGVDKIRDLLFGNQMQDYDRRFSKLEERFLQRFKDIESETARNLSAFESNAKKQVESLVGQLREEKDLRADADKEIERTLREHNQALEKRLRATSDQLSQLERDMADRLTQERSRCVRRSSARMRIFSTQSRKCSPSSATSRPIATCWPGCSSRSPSV